MIEEDIDGYLAAGAARAAALVTATAPGLAPVVDKRQEPL